MVYPAHKHEKRFGKEYWDDINRYEEASWETREPYKALHTHLQKLSRNVRVIVVIRYSFHDDGVNASLAEAVNADRETEVLVVDPGREYYVKRTDSITCDPSIGKLQVPSMDCRWSQFTWLRGRFGEKPTTSKMLQAITGRTNTARRICEPRTRIHSNRG
jgi:hypothetical protein